MTPTPVITWHREPDGVVVVTLDDPAAPVNRLTVAFRHQLHDVAARLARERDSVAGVILRSAKSTFFAGADLTEIAALSGDGVERFGRDLDACKADLRRMETLGVPVVAVLTGSALGGGLEIALACHHRVALDRNGIEIGLPEVTLGLLPGGGGVTRAVRLLGPDTALRGLLLHGQRLDPRTALDLGVIDAVVATEPAAMAHARDWIRDHPRSAQRWHRTDATPEPAATWRDRRAALNHAQRAVLNTALEGATLPVDAALARETERFLDLLRAPAARRLVELGFFDIRDVRRRSRVPVEQPVDRITIQGPDAPTARLRAVIAARMPVRHEPAPSAHTSSATGGEPDPTGALYLASFGDAARWRWCASPAEATEAAGRVDPATAVLLRTTMADFGRTLLEILPSAATTERTLARAVELGHRLGFLVIPQYSGPPPLSLRLRSAREDEIRRMRRSGVPAAAILAAGVAAGYREAALRAALDAPVPTGRTEPLHRTGEIRDRLVFAEAACALRNLRAGTVAHPAEVNLVSVLGAGFPEPTGGALRFFRDYPGGARAFVTRARHLASRWGPTFRLR